MTLSALADLHGVATAYDDWAGRSVDVRPEAVVAALAALDVDAGSPQAVATALAAAEQAPWDAVLPPCVVVRRSRQVVDVRVRHGAGVRLEAVLEDGTRVACPDPGREVARRGDVVHRVVVLPDLPLGWHVLSAGLDDGAVHTCHLVVAPDRVPALRGRHWGWQVQLYAVRSAASWGIGDYADLRALAQAAAADGAEVLLVNPLHAETPVLPVQPSPYSPSSRLFRSPLGLRLEDVAEARGVDLSALRPPQDDGLVDRDAVWTAKLAGLRQLWPLHRAADLAAFRHDRGAALEDFALFCALAQEHGAPWQAWPVDLQDPRSTGVTAARERLAQEVSFWCWVQLLVDEQLAAAGHDLALGVLHDLAVGVDAGGADAWALQDVLALGTSVGAPPDSFNQQGQDWGLPPWRPDRLREHGYLPFREMVRGVLRHAGGIRIDHVMGLSRLWWVPAGHPASDGTYVSYDAEALLGVLALEAVRAGAVVVGEDLGTVEPVVREQLAAAGVLGSAVLWFQTDDDGRLLPLDRWRAEALASVTTHDLPTASGFLLQEHVQVRADLDLLAVPVEDEADRATQERDRLVELLEQTGLLSPGATDREVVVALHRALVASPCQLVLASYADAVGDRRQPNLPGTVDAYPNWRQPLADETGRPLRLEQLLAHPGVREIAAVLQGVRGA